MESPFRVDLLKGKVALITGGGTGICFGIAQVFGRHGAKIAITGRRQQVLDEAVKQLEKDGISAAGFTGDVRDFNSIQNVVQQTISHFGKLDILVNGAAGNFICAAEDLSANAFKTVIGIDLLGTFNACKASYNALKASKGNIINISATLHYGATMYQSHASAAKAGVDSLTRSLAIEWGPNGIRVNGIAPGPIADTEGMKRLGAGVSEEESSKYIPLRRFGKTSEIGLTALFFASEATAAYISGDTIVVDGAMWLSRPTKITSEIYQYLQEEAKKQKETKQKSRL